MSEKSLSQLRKYLHDNLGLNFTKNQEKELCKKIEQAGKDFNYDNTDAFISWLLKTKLIPKQIEKLASFLTIGETYFFREVKALDYLEHNFLPELINNRRGKKQRLRIWSAGCASGEEPYSVAILLKRVIPDIKSWNISVLATDINAAFLEKARTGIYTNWSFRKLSGSFKENYFTELGPNKFQINPEIRSMVTFAYQNLATDTYPSLINGTNAMDIILNRNVLIYFSNDGIKQVSNRFYNSLTKGGVFLVSPVEMSNLISPKFGIIPYLGYTIYTKGPTKVEQKGVVEWEVSDTDEIRKTPQQILNTEINKSPVKPTGIKPEKQDQVEKEQKVKNSDYESALALFNQGKFDEAENKLNNIFANREVISKQALCLLIKTKANLGKLNEALALCNKALKTNKLEPNLHFLIANIQQEKGNLAEAILSLKRVIYLDPDFPLAHFSLGNLCLKSGKDLACINHYKNALGILAKLDPDEVLKESDGLTAGRLAEIIKSIKG